MTKSQKMRLSACNTALLETIDISQSWYNGLLGSGDDQVLLAQITALKNIQVVLEGIIDEK